MASTGNTNNARVRPHAPPIPEVDEDPVRDEGNEMASPRRIGTPAWDDGAEHWADQTANETLYPELNPKSSEGPVSPRSIPTSTAPIVTNADRRRRDFEIKGLRPPPPPSPPRVRTGSRAAAHSGIAPARPQRPVASRDPGLPGRHIERVSIIHNPVEHAEPSSDDTDSSDAVEITNVVDLPPRPVELEDDDHASGGKADDEDDDASDDVNDGGSQGDSDDIEMVEGESVADESDEQHQDKGEQRHKPPEPEQAQQDEEMIDRNAEEGGAEIQNEQAQPTQGRKRKLDEAPEPPGTKIPASKRTKSNAVGVPEGPTFTREEEDNLGRASTLFTSVLGSVFRRNARMGAREGIMEARAATGPSPTRTRRPTTTAGPSNQQINNGVVESSARTEQDEVREPTPRPDKNHKNCRAGAAGGCGKPYTSKNPAVSCSIRSCRNRKYCTECKDIRGKGYFVQGTDLWFCTEKCYQNDPAIEQAKAKKKDDEDARRKREENEEAERQAAAIAKSVGGSHSIAKAIKKKREKEREKQEALEALEASQKNQEEATPETEDLEQEDDEKAKAAAARLEAKPTDPIADRCAKCKKKWGRNVVHAECQFDGCGGHSLCETCKGKVNARTKFAGGWTLDKPYVWFCSDVCRKGWYDELEGDEQAKRDRKNGELDKKPKKAGE
ncbi:hypothetical protein FKW77_004768 [Venturia effusa]|uniref:Uncharacterized protein n=1 Tax=Venturia effusa TaxID=50376 RepID=A0A517LQ46_9PEZI|nr:hypothetical protein FKW77_004768 [Venturia effusa]